ncbi:autotransporter phospholipase A1 FplA [Fusobacterium polymorphum]|uniref:Serine protease n=1 Tax=Fusobacterium nucleatum subsp. polymorphum TaxID=76857 RepID=A0A2C6C870_FUSNP|nr:autotransporter phospholipase A1 FplA [Fusobacterium polymorphum]PHI12633.1 serine protease [Fusobacterium polymorphum]PHI16621.1 serine protease [Fusobacterium polymorphum]WRL78695.1 autotransporter phospholipase A1 FplA [Fusobacterium polymorphum]
MKKIFFLIYIFLNFSLAYSKNIELKSREDVEIENLESQIKVLEDKIQTIKKLKNDKDRNDLKVALVLSGGGAKGYAHLGVLRVLEKENIKIDYIAGTSIGALVGTLYSIGYSVDEIEKVLDNLNIESFLESGSDLTGLDLDKKETLKKYSFYINFDNELNYSLPKGLRETEELYLVVKNLLKKYENIKNFDNFPIPLRVVATNLNTGETKSFSEGDIAKVLTASMAIPTIFEPVEVNGALYVDGLVSRNLPVEEAYDMGADLVIASDVGTPVVKKDNYNILSVLNQMIAIQSSYITKASKEKATILISPDIKNISATDTTKRKDLIELGEVATQSQIAKLREFPKNSSNNKRTKVQKEKEDYFVINKIEYNPKFDKNTIDILNNIFKNLLNKPISENDIEKKIIDVYNSKYMDKLYYTVEDGILHLDGEKGHLNRIGVGFNYQTGYGTTFNVGTDLFFSGKFGNNINLNFKFGDYLGADLGTLTYYGIRNRFGILTNIGYNESPFFLYNNRRKLAKFMNREAYLNIGIFNQPSNNSMISYGVLSKLSSLKQDTGGSLSQNLEYSENLTKTYLRVKYDNLDSISNPMKGIKADFIYNFASSFGKSKSNLYGPAYSIKGYVPINSKSSFVYGLNLASLRGDRIRADQRIRLGGSYTNINNNEFEFYGLNYQEKQVKDLISLTLGFKHKIVYSLYFNTKFNIATFTEDNPLNNNDSRLWKNYSKGLGISISYDSPIGPIEFSVSSDLKHRRPIGSISIGYKLD